MAAIRRYVLVDKVGHAQDYEYADFTEAKWEAQHSGWAVIEREYEYIDSRLVWTPNGGDVWPPKRSAP